jgi:rhamnulokinase
VLSEASRRANFTNELGVDGTVRYLRNVMGLWLLQESLRVWERAGDRHDLDALVRAAAQAEPFRSIIDPDDPVFLPPGDMPARIAATCEQSGQPVPAAPAHTVRCILDSLALAYRRTVRDAQRLADHEVDVVHLVGGGSRNAVLCQLTADASGLPVVAGPVEATALGNVLVQARALGALSGGLDTLRRVVREAGHLRRYEPSGNTAAWNAAEARLDIATRT